MFYHSVAVCCTLHWLEKRREKEVCAWRWTRTVIRNDIGVRLILWKTMSQCLLPVIIKHARACLLLLWDYENSILCCEVYYILLIISNFSVWLPLCASECPDVAVCLPPMQLVVRGVARDSFEFGLKCVNVNTGARKHCLVHFEMWIFSIKATAIGTFCLRP